VPSGADAATVLNATKRFVEAYEAGEEMDVVVARALGYKTIEDVPEAQRAYASKIADKLESNARTLRGEIEAATKKYESGVAAYGRGMYDDAVKWFSAAAEETSETSLLGGKIAIYKALALDAYGQRDKALDIYKYVESVHPEKSIRKQAEELRYILEAPRMELREDERVDVPDSTRSGCVSAVQFKVVDRSQAELWRSETRKVARRGIRGRSAGKV
jgi:RNA exonuclease 1